MAQTMGVDLAIQELQWPVDLGDELPAIVAEELCEAAKTFPDDTRLGWDRWHPKVVCRLSPQLLQLLVVQRVQVQRVMVSV